MDKSELYIKMCDCTEIQEKWEIIHWGDFVNDRDGLTWPLLSVLHVNKEDFIWLPRQDQLQDMYCSVMVDGKHHRKAFSYLACFNVLCEEIYEFSKYDCNMEIKSMEQLWLAFVMKEKYGKVWSNSWETD